MVRKKQKSREKGKGDFIFFIFFLFILAFMVLKSIGFRDDFIGEVPVSPYQTEQIWSDGDKKMDILLNPYDRKQINCLAQNIYFEARGESADGKLAVALVTLNRLASRDYADTVCGVVYQKIRKTYQFSWVADRDTLSINNQKLFQECEGIAKKAYIDRQIKNVPVNDITGGATFYYAKYIKAPKWAYIHKHTVNIGLHRFYKKVERVSSEKRT